MKSMRTLYALGFMVDSSRLSPREAEIIERLGRPGAKQTAVAYDLGITLRTLKTHLDRIYRKLGVNSFGQAERELYEPTHD